MHSSASKHLCSDFRLCRLSDKIASENVPSSQIEQFQCPRKVSVRSVMLNVGSGEAVVTYLTYPDRHGHPCALFCCTDKRVQQVLFLKPGGV